MAKPPFNPNQPFEAVGDNTGAKPPFNPNQPFQEAPQAPAMSARDELMQPSSLIFGSDLAKHQAAPATSLGSKLQTGAENALDTLTLGHGPNLEAAVQSLGSDQSRVALRDQNKARLVQESQENPYMASSGRSAGMAAPMMFGNVASAAGPLEEAGLLTRAARGFGSAGKIGTALGFLQNPGDVQGQDSGLQLGDRLTNAFKGGLLGGLGGAATEAASALPEAIENNADLRGALSLRPYKADIKALKKNVPGQLEEVGKTLYKKGILEPGASIPKTSSTLAEDTQTALDKTGKEIGTLLDDLNLKLSNKSLANPGESTSVKVGVDKKRIADSIRSKFLRNGHHPSTVANNREVEDFASKLEEGDPIIGINDARELKKDAQADANFDRNPKVGPSLSLDEKMNQHLYHAVDDGIENAGDAAVKELGTDLDPNFVKKYGELKQDYRNLKIANRMASRRELGDFANRTIGMSEMQGGQAGAALGALGGQSSGRPIEEGILGAGLGGLAANATKLYGNQVVANTLKRASKSPMLKGQGMDAVNRLIQERPGLLANPIVQGLLGGNNE